MLKKLFLLSCLATNLYAIESIAQFNAPIKHLCHDYASDSFYVGLAAGGGPYALAHVQKTGHVTPLAIDRKLKSQEVVALCQVGGHLACVVSKSPSMLQVLPPDEPMKIKQQKVLDASDTEVAAITHLAASDTHIFARVLSRSGTGDGVAVLSYDGQALAHVGTTSLDAHSAAVRHGDALTSLQVNDLHWDNELKRLYVALSITIAKTSRKNIMRGNYNTGYAVVVGTLDDVGKLHFAPLTNALAVPNLPSAIVAYTAGCSPQAVYDEKRCAYVEHGDLPAMFTDAELENYVSTEASIAIKHIRTMHTSTGLRYLVCSGGVQRRSFTRLTLVDDGRLAAIEPMIVTDVYHAAGQLWVLPIGSKHTPQAGHLCHATVSQSEDRSQSLFATALASPFSYNEAQRLLCDGVARGMLLPKELENRGKNEIGTPVIAEYAPGDYMHDVVVQGDGIYYQLHAGMWGRQPSFDAWGAISGWHPVARVFPADEESGRTFALSARDAKVTVARGSELVQQQWERDADSTITVGKEVSSLMPEGVYAIHECVYGAILFGGLENVVLCDAQAVVRQVRDGLAGAGAVVSLGGIDGCYLAGTQTGLYYLRDESSPWERAREITGAVSEIAQGESGQNALVLVQDETLVDKLYVVAPDAITKVAEIGQGGLPSGVIAIGATMLGDCYGLLATSNGLYVSDAGFEEWHLVPETDGLAFTSLHSHRNGLTPVWGVVATNDGIAAPNRYARSRLVQFGASLGGGGITVRPTPYRQATAPDDRGFFTSRGSVRSLAPVHGVFSDGGRRMVLTREQDETDLLQGLRSLPYDLAAWGLEGPARDTALSGVTRVHCVTNLRGLGLLVAGTDNGLIALE